MARRQMFDVEPDVIDQLAGVTGVCWTASILAYLGTAFGYGAGLGLRFVVEPRLLLVLGCVFLVATFGLDELQRTRSEKNP